MSRLDWDDLRFVLALAEARSYAAAGRLLKVTHVTVMRRVTALEASLAAKLFERSNDGFALTGAGEEIASYAEQVREGIRSLERRLAGFDNKPAVVRLTTTDTLMHGFVAQALARFASLHPEMRCDVSTTSHFLNLSRGEADIALRPSDFPPDSLIGRLVADVAYAIYAAPALASTVTDGKRLEFGTVSDTELPWIGMSENLKHLHAAKWQAENIRPTNIKVRFDSLLDVKVATAAGLGYALLPCFLADDDSSLARVSAVIPELNTQLWLLCHRDIKALPRIRILSDFLVSAFKASRHKFNPSMP